MMSMDLLSSVSMPIYIASFVLLAYQYFRTSGAYFDIGLHFWLMVGALILMFLAIFLNGWRLSVIFFSLSLFWLLLSLYLFRRMLRAD